MATFVPLSGRVPDEKIEAARINIEACSGIDIDLDGWLFEYALTTDVKHCGGRESFDCAGVIPGCEKWACPCRCSGLTQPDPPHVAVTPDLHSLPHEILHIAFQQKYGDLDNDHVRREWARCLK